MPGSQATWMPCRILCNGTLQKSQEARSGLGLASSHCTSLHNNRYGIFKHCLVGKPGSFFERLKNIKKLFSRLGSITIYIQEYISVKYKNAFLPHLLKLFLSWSIVTRK